MAILKIEAFKYDTPEALRNVFYYVNDNYKSCGLVGAQNIQVNCTLEQSRAINRYYYDTTKVTAIHFMILFAPDDYIEPNNALYESYNVCALLPEYQIRFSVHQNTDNLHIHFVMNPINLTNGRKFYFDYSTIVNFVKNMEQIFEPYKIKVIWTPNTLEYPEWAF